MGVEFDSSLLLQCFPGQKAMEANLRSGTAEFLPPAKNSKTTVKTIPFMIPLNVDKVIPVVQNTIHPHLLAKKLDKDQADLVATWPKLLHTYTDYV